MRNTKVDKDARALVRQPDALREAKRNIDLAIADQDLGAITHWTSVWFKVQELALGQADVDRDASTKASPPSGRRSPHKRAPAGALVALSD
jgi:hypothetical protein